MSDHALPFRVETWEEKEAKSLKNEEKKLDLRKRKLDLDKEEFEWELEKEKKTLAASANDDPVADDDDEHVYQGITLEGNFIELVGEMPTPEYVDEMETRYREAYKQMHGHYPHTVFRRGELEKIDEFLDKEKAMALANDAPDSPAGAASARRNPRRKRQ